MEALDPAVLGLDGAGLGLLSEEDVPRGRDPEHRHH